jgi:hypothetical protein
MILHKDPISYSPNKQRLPLTQTNLFAYFINFSDRLSSPTHLIAYSHIKQRSPLHHPTPDRLLPTPNSDRPLLKANPDRVSMLLFYNQIGYIVQCNDTK